MNDRLDLQTLTASILRRWLVVLLVTAAAALLGYVASVEQTETYEAVTSVLVAQDPPGVTIEDSDRALKEQLALTFAEMAVRSPVLEPSARLLGIDDWRALRTDVAVRLAPKTLLLDVVVQADSPEAAARAADVVAAELVRVSGPYSPYVQQQVGPALADPSPVAPNVRMNTLFAGIIGFIVASAAALVLELAKARRQRSFRSSDAVPFLGVVRAKARTSPTVEPDGAATEEASQIIANLRVAMRPDPVRTVLVTGRDEHDRTRVTLQLAAVYAQGGLSTVVVDLGLRDPVVNVLTRTGLAPGVAELLEERSASRAFTRTVRERLRVLPAGSASLNPSMLLGSDVVSRLVDAFDPPADVVVFDMPLTERVGEVGLVAEQADATVLVVANRLTRAEERRAAETLTSLGVPPDGVVVVHHSFWSRIVRPPDPSAAGLDLEAEVADLPANGSTTTLPRAERATSAAPQARRNGTAAGDQLDEVDERTR